MKRAFSVLLGGFLLTTSVTAARADYMDDVARKMRNWNPHVGNIQDTKAIQQAGPIQQLAAPKPKEAVTEKKLPCSHRISVCSDTLFEFDKATLTPDAEAALSIVGPEIKAQLIHPILIEGHTDGLGSDDYNQKLSEKRAERVRNWMMENHYLDRSVPIVGFGKKHPAVPNTNPDGTDNPKNRQLNRRVVIVVDTCKTFDAAAPTTSTPTTPGVVSPGSNQMSGSMIIDDAPASTPKPADSAPSVAKNNEIMPFDNLVSDAQIKEGFFNMRITPLDDPKLYLEVLTPKDWESRPLTVSKSQIANDDQAQVPLADLGPPNAPEISTQIKYMRVQPGVSPEDFLLSFAKMTGAEIVLRQHADYKGRKAEDALFKKISADTKKEMYSRITTSKRGDYMFVISSTVPQADYEKWKRIFGIAAVSFNPCGK